MIEEHPKLLVKLLGPLEVSVGDQVVTVSGARRRTLLARLAIAAGQPVGAERLAEDLWEGKPPPGAAHTLQSHISQLRRLLPAGTLIGANGAYRLLASLDSTCFADTLDQARRCRAAGDLPAAMVDFTAALAWWRGAALVDVVDAEWAAPERVRLDELRLVAIEEDIECRLDTGQVGDVVGRCEAALVEHPLRERLWQALMLGLARSGRTADALRAYQRLRHVLADELGINPSPESAAIERRILTGEPDPVTPSLIAEPLTRAWSDSTPLLATPPIVLPATPPAARTTPDTADPRQRGGSDAQRLLPPLIRSCLGRPFVGRDRELAVLAAVAARCDPGGPAGIAVISGAPGIGKTTLAALALNSWAQMRRAERRIVAAGCRSDALHPGDPLVEICRQLDVDIPLPDGETGDPEFARALRVHRLEQAIGDAAARSAAPAAGLAMLVDDVQWADAMTATVLRRLLPRLAGSLVILTLRHPDTTATSSARELIADLRRGVVLPPAVFVELDGLSREETSTLLERVAPSGSTWTDATARDIHRRAGGNPLFITALGATLGSPATEPIGGNTPGGAPGGAGIGVIALGSAANRAPNPAPDRRDTTSSAATASAATAGAMAAGVADLINAMLTPFGEPTIEALTAAAVLGPRFSVGQLTAALGLDPDAVLDRLELARRGGVVVEAGDRWAFAHELTCETLIGRLGIGRQRRIHRRVAAAPRSRTSIGVAERASHWERGWEPGDELAAAAALRAAGMLELRLGEVAAAVRWYSAARSILDSALSRGDRGDPRVRPNTGSTGSTGETGNTGDTGDTGNTGNTGNTGGTSEHGHSNESAGILGDFFRETDGEVAVARFDLDVAIAQAGWLDGDHQQRTRLHELADEALRRGWTQSAATAVLAAGRGFTSHFTAIDATRQGLLERVLAAGPGDAVAARVLADLAIETPTWDAASTAAELADRAVATARRSGDRAAFEYAVVIGASLALPGRFAAVESLLVEVPDITVTSDFGAVAVLNHHAAALRRGDGEAMRRHEATLEGLASGRHARSDWLVALCRARRAELDGDFSAAEDLARTALRIGSTGGHHDAGIVFHHHLWSIRRRQGRLGELLEPLRRGVGVVPADLLAPLAVAEAEFGDADHAARLFSDVATAGFVGGGLAALRLPMLALWCEVAATLDDLAQSSVAPELLGEARLTLANHLAPFAEVVIEATPNVYGAGAHFMAVALRTIIPERAESLAAMAERIHRRLGAVPLIERSRVLRASLLQPNSKPLSPAPAAISDPTPAATPGPTRGCSAEHALAPKLTT